MNGTCRALLLLTIAAVAAGCASGKAYFSARGRDAADIVTLSLGVGGGAKARVGPLHAGLFFAADLYGVRNGCVLTGGQMCPGGPGGLEVDSLLIPMSRDELPGLFPVIFGMEAFPDRGLPSGEGDGFGAAVSMLPFISIPCPIDKGIPVHSATAAKYLTQIEVAGGLCGTVRLGFNAGELLDFVLGWTTVDIFRDDRASRPSAPAADAEAMLNAKLAAEPAGASRNDGPDSEYVIRPGDTGAKIAKRHGLSVGELLALNPNLDLRRLKVGQRVKVKRDE